MKSSLWIAIVLVLTSAGALAQNKSYKVKSSTTEKAPRSTVAVPEKMSTGNSAAKNLQSIERESAKPVAPSTAKKTGTASTVKPIKEESNPPINFTGKSQAKQGGMINQGPNPYKGRLKEKGAQQQ